MFIFIPRYPFDTRHPIGYSISCVIEYIALVNETFVVMCIFCFCLGTTLLVISLADDINYTLGTLNSHIIRLKKDRIEVIEKIPRLIEFHTHAIQLSHTTFLIPLIDAISWFHVEQAYSSLLIFPHSDWLICLQIWSYIFVWSYSHGASEHCPVRCY